MVNVIAIGRACAAGFAAAMLAATPARANVPDIAAAVDYCRGYPKSVRLNAERTILCFDGNIDPSPPNAPFQYGSSFRELAQDGFFVVRSRGGWPLTAMTWSDMLREKNATVIVYDYCFSACANYFLVATARTHVVRNTVVAWHGGPSKYDCSRAGNPELYYRRRYGTDYALYHDMMCKVSALSAAFFRQRGIDDRHIYRAPTWHTRQIVELAMRQHANKRNILWMWHPHNHKDHFRSRISYEAYPQSQEEVDRLMAALRPPVRVFYDWPQ
jgi:hypothetical protein